MKVINYIGLAGILLIPNMSQALDWSQDWADWEVRPRLGTGLINYEYQQQAFVDTTIETADTGTVLENVLAADRIEVSDSLLFAEIGVSVFLGNFFVDISYQKSDEGEDAYSQDAFVTSSGIGEEISSLALGTVNFEKQREIDREELAVSIGYAVTENFGVYAGYKRNDTQFDDQIRSGRVEVDVVSASDPINIFGEEVGIGSRGFQISEVSGPTNIELEQDGFFVGATFVLPFESNGWLNGALSFDLGLAFLNGEQSVTDGTVRTVITSSFDADSTTDEVTSAGTQNTSGDAVGVNVGLAWTGPLTERLSYSIGVDGYQYDYESDDVVDFQDTVIRFSAGVSYAIDSNGFR